MVYALVLVFCTLSHMLLVNSLIKLHGLHSNFSTDVNRDRNKGNLTLAINLIAIFVAYMDFPRIAFLIIVLTALKWFVPNRIMDKI